MFGSTPFLIFINSIHDVIVSRIGNYTDDTSIYAWCINNPDRFENLKLATDFEYELQSVNFINLKFKAYKRKTLSCNHIRWVLLSFSVSDAGHQERYSLCLLGHTFSHVIKWGYYNEKYKIAMSVARNIGSLYNARQ